MMENLTISKNNVTATFLPTGDFVGITAGEIMINQLNGQAFDGSLAQLYLRIFKGNDILFAPLIGSNSKSIFKKNDKGAFWQGEFESVRYNVSFTISDTGLWFWTVELDGSNQVVDVIYGQDLGNANPGAVLSNEAYMSQYLDHKVTQTREGFIISSRQNQIQGNLFPVVEQGSLTKTVGFSTDGYQFFGREYKENEIPKALKENTLSNEVYQYEFAYTAFQSEKYSLTGKENVIFYGGIKDNLSTAVKEPLFSLAEVEKAYDPVYFSPFEGNVSVKLIGDTLFGKELTKEEVDNLFPEKKLVEKEDEKLLSFFTPQNHHVVLKEKEIRQERATGHILLSGMDLTVDNPPMSSTVYMYGLFNSQIVLGNTSMNKLMSNSRNSLNVQKLSGQRMYLKKGNFWHNLGMPSAFEMGLNSATWYYKFKDDFLTITTYSYANGHEIRTIFKSKNHIKYTVAITNHLLMGAEESFSGLITKEGSCLKITPAENSPIYDEYPQLIYYMALNTDFSVTTEELFNIDDNKLTVFTLNEVDEFQLVIQGTLKGEEFKNHETSLENEDSLFANHIDDLVKGFYLESKNVEVESMNTLIRWYTHNMLVHYLSPHGLEQYGGAAWGTRDVSQGPTEFFLAMDRPDVVKSIISHVFSNQFSDDGNWPQWFMFDKYETQKSGESHGDVIVWPMKIVSDYLVKTDDYDILSMLLPYSNRSTFRQTTEKDTLMNHLKKEIQYIESNFLPGTYLSCYGDGDWDDTLQPNNSLLKKNMASSWTVALTYQVIGSLANVLASYDEDYAKHLDTLQKNIKSDYERYMLSTEVIPGFVYLNKNNDPELMIHPTDKKTGIHYRLLPMTRSMIAGLLSPERVHSHYDIIKDNLYFPDGVRLMDRPAHYTGGVSINFKRAEQAANFGREIGLQYVHAHIRFSEAMAKIGKKNETWKALQKINPIQLKNRVTNAEIRQSNVYFSSSDGDFKTRYEAQEKFGNLKDGSVGVKGGWRIYSSGPGIFINQLTSNILGIRESKKNVIFDPVLPNDFDGTTLRRVIAGKKVTICYHINGAQQDIKVDDHSIQWTEEKNPYREGGMIISMSELVCLRENSVIDIYR